MAEFMQNSTTNDTRRGSMESVCYHSGSCTLREVRMSKRSNRNSGCLMALFGIFLGRTKGDQSHTNGMWPYKTRDGFLTSAELSFYGVLTSTIGSRATICPKVGLRDLFWVAASQDYQAHWNRISQKHVDFLLCHPQTMQPLLAIELDDSSHSSPRRQHRDADVDHIFEAAGLPLVRVPTQRSYQTQDLSTGLNPYLNNLPAVSTPTPVVPEMRRSHGDPRS